MSKTNYCRSCHSNKFKKVLSLGNLHLSEFINARSKIKSKKYPLNLIQCQKCTLVQLDSTVAPSLLYNNNYGYVSGINSTMRSGLKSIAKSASKFAKLKAGDTVIDIGSNDGTLLKIYKAGVKKIGYDLVPKFKKFYDQKDMIFVNRPFGASKFRAKIITAIGMFYDIDRPNEFLSNVNKSLADDGVFVIQQNYLIGMLRDLAFDNIVHEHLSYYSLLSLENLLKKHDLEVFDVLENNINGGSFRTYIQKRGGKHKISANILKMRNSEKKIKTDGFEAKIKKSAEKIYKFIQKETQGGKTIFVYGASTRGNTLLQYAGLTNKIIKYAVERNPEKYGKKIGSTGIPIISEVEARKLKPDYMLVLPWYFREEIIKREKRYLKSGGHLIFPLPKFEVYPR